MKKTKLLLMVMAVVVLSVSSLGALGLGGQKASAAPISNNLVYTAYNRNGGGSSVSSMDATTEASITNYAGYSGYQGYFEVDVNTAKTRLYATIRGSSPFTMPFDSSVGVSFPDFSKGWNQCELPAVSPDDTKLVCLGTIFGTDQVKKIDLVTNSVTTMTIPGVSNIKYGINWISDTKLVVSVQLAQPGCGSYSLATINLDGSGLTPLMPCDASFDGQFYMRYPEVSRDKTKITYWYDNSIWIMSVDGTNKQRVISTDSTHNYDRPSLTPDNKYLAMIDQVMVNGSTNVTNIAIVDVATGNVVKRIPPRGVQFYGGVRWAGNFVPADAFPPVVSGVPVGTPDANGWFDSDVTINWTAVDPSPSSGTPTQPAPTVASLEGEHAYTSAPSCDPLGNCASGSITLKIDKAAPTISYSLSQQPNAAGWNNGPVTVTFSCADAGGVQSCSQPVTVSADGLTTVTGTVTDKSGKTTSIEVPIKVDTIRPTITFTAVSNGWVNTPAGVPYQCTNEDGSTTDYVAPVVADANGQTSASGTCTDAAGNATTQVIPVQVDADVPDVEYQLSQPVNALGWSTGPVTVTFQCDDPNGGSGIDFCTAPVTVTDQGVTVVTGTGRDVAGNVTEVNVFVAIDSVKPTLDYVISPASPNEAGWYTGDVVVSFTCSDATSGVASCPQPVTVSSDTTSPVIAEAVDIAGNRQSVSVPINRDATAPEINFTLSQAPNAAGWNNQATTVSFTCSDATSGIASCSEPVTVGTEGGVIITGAAVDNAGNQIDVNVFVLVDTSLPTIEAVTAPVLNGGSWNNSDVTVNFVCADAVSGVANCSGPVTVSSDIAEQEVTGTVTDLAGNSATVTVAVKLDKTAPVLGAFSWSQNPKPVTGSTILSVPTTEALSGVIQAEYYLGDTDPGLGNGATMQIGTGNVTTTFGSNFATGVYKVTVRTRDAAGNWSAASSDYLVVYNPSGFRITGKSKNDFTVSSSNGSVLPFLTSGVTLSPSFGFNARYASNGVLDQNNDFQFRYTVGTQCNNPANVCHTYELNAAQIAWFTTSGTNDSTGTIQGVASQSIDGVVSQVPFRIVGIDGARLTGNNNANDNFELQVFAPGANPNTATPVYRVAPTAVAKQSFRIQ